MKEFLKKKIVKNKHFDFFGANIHLVMYCAASGQIKLILFLPLKMVYEASKQTTLTSAPLFPCICRHTNETNLFQCHKPLLFKVLYKEKEKKIIN